MLEVVATQKQAFGGMGTFAPGTSAQETNQLMVGGTAVANKASKFKTKVCFSIHEALQAKQLGLKSESIYNGISGQSSEVFQTQPCRIISQTLGLDEIEVSMSIRELKQNDHQHPHKVRFDTQMEIMNPKEVSKLINKNLHLFLYEDVPVADPKQKIKSMMRPVMDCEDVA
jgi:hypothetical protein